MYAWRRLTPEQQQEVLEHRIRQHRPWHSPPQRGCRLRARACFEHVPHIGRTPARLAEFSRRLIETMERNDLLYAWCVLPNHYHLLAETTDLRRLKKELGKLHGRAACEWNLEEHSPGRKIWHRCADRAIRGSRHYWATINYIHHNPVHHGYARRWKEWPFSSAREFVERLGRDQALAIWRQYPVLDYGAGWDEPET